MGTNGVVRILVALLSGALFGVGLVVSGMMNPQKVTAFLDFAGGSGYRSLIFVMGGALLVSVPACSGFSLEAVRSSIGDDLGMRKTGDREGPGQPENPHPDALPPQVHNTL